MKRTLIGLTVIALALCAGVAETRAADGHSTAVYRPQGGAELVVGTGGTLEIKSGGTIVVQAGATNDINADITTTNITMDTGSTLAAYNVTVAGTLTGSVVSSNATGELTTSNLTANGSATIAGALDVAGEVEGASLDINSAAAADYVRIDQVNVTGVTTEPYIEVTDARTGDNANSAAEATLVLSPSGLYAFNVTAGITVLQALALDGALTGTDATGSSSKDTGAIICQGGIGVEADVYVGSNVVVTGEVSVDGKYAAVGPTATNGVMFDYGGGTFTAQGTVTQLFTVAFGSAPRVTAMYAESSGVGTNAVYRTTVTTSNVIMFGTASKAYDYIAVGQRP